MNDSGSNSDTYWCDLPPEEFAQEAFKRMTPSASSYANGGYGGMFQTIMLAARSAFYGAIPVDWTSGPSSAFVGRDGEQGNIVTLRVNNLRSHALAQHQIVTAPPLSWKAQAVNSDSRSMASATQGSRILEYAWKNDGCDERLIDATLGAIIYGEEFIFSPWSSMSGPPRGYDQEQGRMYYEGDVYDCNIPTWDVLRDATAHSYDESKWKCVRKYVNRWDLIAEWPERKEDILRVAALAPPVDFGAISGPLLLTQNPDKVACYYFFHEVTAALPQGLQAVMLGPDAVLHHGPLEECYREVLPLHRMAAGDLKGTPYGYTSLWEALAIQELADDIQSSLATNIVTFGKQLISAEEGTNLPIDQLTDGPKVIYRPKGAPDPKPLQLSASSPESFEHLGRLKQDIRQVFGLNDIVMGQPDTAQMNAQAFALIASMAVQQNSDLQKRYAKCATSMGRSRLRIYRTKLSTPRKIAIIGKGGPLQHITTSYDASNFESLDDVYTELDSPLAQTAAGRLQIATMFADRGFVQTPEQLQNVVESGRLDPLTQGLQAELIYIAEENEALLEGKPQPVKITDSHQMHIREHRGPTFSAQARGNPQVNIVTDEHIKAHLDFLLNTDPRILAAMGQAAPAPAPAPPAGPGGEAANAGAQEALAGPLNGGQAAAEIPQPPTIQLPGQGGPIQ